jgi:photosystem II stability/assembly factor-like uncharacterized protein
MRVIVLSLIVTLGLLLAVAAGVLRFAERRIQSPSHLGLSASAPVSIQSKVSAQPKPNWKLNAHTLPARASLKRIQMLSGTEGWMAVYPGGLLRTSDAGKTWEPIRLDLPSRTYVTDFFFASPNVGWLSLSRTELDFEPRSGNGSYDELTLIRATTDGGKNWTEELALQGAQVTEIRFAGNGEGWAIGRRFSKGASANDANLILHTTDNGQSWRDVSNNLQSETGVDHLYAITPGRASLLSLNGFLHSTLDGGQSWHQDGVFHDQYEQTSIHRIDVAENGQLWLVGGTSGLEGTRSIFVVKEKEDSWTRYEIGAVDLADAVFLSNDVVLACGSISSEKSSPTRQAVILYSTDRGKNWVIAYRDEQSPSLNSLASLDSKHFLAVGERGLVLQIDVP